MLEAEEFEAAIAPLERVDPELWTRTVRPIAPGTHTDAGFKRGDERCLELMRQADSLLVSVTVVGELLAGFACGSQEARNREALSHGSRRPAWARRGWNAVPPRWPGPTPTA